MSAPPDETLLADIDLRMSSIWMTVWSLDNVLGLDLENTMQRNTFGAILRTAYTKGYLDALQEDTDGRRGLLTKTHGYATP